MTQKTNDNTQIRALECNLLRRWLYGRKIIDNEQNIEITFNSKSLNYIIACEHDSPAELYNAIIDMGITDDSNIIIGNDRLLFPETAFNELIINHLSKITSLDHWLVYSMQEYLFKFTQNPLEIYENQRVAISGVIDRHKAEEMQEYLEDYNANNPSQPHYLKILSEGMMCFAALTITDAQLMIMSGEEIYSPELLTANNNTQNDKDVQETETKQEQQSQDDYYVPNDESDENNIKTWQKLSSEDNYESNIDNADYDDEDIFEEEEDDSVYEFVNNNQSSENAYSQLYDNIVSDNDSSDSDSDKNYDSEAKEIDNQEKLEEKGIIEEIEKEAISNSQVTNQLHTEDNNQDNDITEDIIAEQISALVGSQKTEPEKAARKPYAKNDDNVNNNSIASEDKPQDIDNQESKDSPSQEINKPEELASSNQYQRKPFAKSARFFGKSRQKTLPMEDTERPVEQSARKQYINIAQISQEQNTSSNPQEAPSEKALSPQKSPEHKQDSVTAIDNIEQLASPLPSPAEITASPAEEPEEKPEEKKEQAKAQTITDTPPPPSLPEQPSPAAQLAKEEQDTESPYHEEDKSDNKLSQEQNPQAANYDFMDEELLSENFDFDSSPASLAEQNAHGDNSRNQSRDEISNENEGGFPVVREVQTIKNQGNDYRMRLMIDPKHQDLVLDHLLKHTNHKKIGRALIMEIHDLNSEDLGKLHNLLDQLRLK